MLRVNRWLLFPHPLRQSLNARPLQRQRNETEPLPLAIHQGLASLLRSMQRCDYMSFYQFHATNTEQALHGWQDFQDCKSLTVCLYGQYSSFHHCVPHRERQSSDHRPYECPQIIRYASLRAAMFYRFH